MNVYRYSNSELPLKGSPVVTVGSFDGVHLGHKSLLATTIKEARGRNVESILVTFDPHPRTVLKPHERTWLLTPGDEKISLISRAGIDTTVIVPFDEAFARMGYGEFIDRFLKLELHTSAIVVGYDHRFGHNKTGDHSLLQDTGLETIRVPELTGVDTGISSTQVRRAISGGNLDIAASVLGHRYFASGEIIASPSGDGILFHPLHPDKLMPPEGKYRIGISADNSPRHEGYLTVSGGVYRISDPAPPLGCGRAVLEFL